MTQALGIWIRGLVGAAVLTSVSMMLTPEGKTRKVVSLVCGLVIMTVLIKPIVGFDYSGFSRSMAEYRFKAGDFSREFQETNEKLTGYIIEEECAAYILDKGISLGISDLKVSVSAKWSEDGYWYPESAALETVAGEDLREKLGRQIQESLGIPPEELIWRMSDE